MVAAAATARSSSSSANTAVSVIEATINILGLRAAGCGQSKQVTEPLCIRAGAAQLATLHPTRSPQSFGDVEPAALTRPGGQAAHPGSAAAFTGDCCLSAAVLVRGPRL
jgi:hypothetical protein